MKELRESTDVWFSSYLVSKGIQIAEYDVLARGKVKCKFLLTSDEWHQLKLEFNNSPLVKYKAIIEQIKDLGY